MDIIKDVIKELKTNPYLVSVDINESNYQDFYYFHKDYLNCTKCPGLDKCSNTNKGFTPSLSSYKTSYKMCSLLKKENRSNVKPLFISESLLI